MLADRYFRSASLAAAATLALAATWAEGFLIQTIEGRSGYLQLTWASERIAFSLDAGGTRDLGASRTHGILREAFQVWQEVSTARIGFEDRGLTSTSASGRDGVNVLDFRRNRGVHTGAPGDAPDRGHPDPLGSETGKITDADIVFNGRDFITS